MTLDEVIEEIVSKPKYYIGIMPQSTAANFLIRYRAGSVKTSTAERFIAKFGYSIKKPAEYKKDKNK